MVKDMRDYVIKHPLFQVMAFAFTMIVIGALGFVYAQDYVSTQARYQVNLHVAAGSHDESQISYYTLLLGQYRLNIGSIRAEIRKWEAGIFEKRNASDGSSQIEVQMYKGIVEELKQELFELRKPIGAATKQLEYFSKKVQDRKPPERP